MEIQVEALKRCQLVTLSGQVDSANAPQFEERLLDIIDGGTKNLVINLRGVDFMSSAGLSALLRARIRVRKKLPPGEIVLSEMSPQLKGTFELVGLHHIFRFYDRDVEAIGSF
jgi:anti-anti-sigma factor